LVPAYNPNPVDLLCTIQSIKDQTVASDILIVDDGSAIRVSEIISEADNIFIIRSEKNGGIVDALNKGLRFAQQGGYKYVARMDCGDSCLRDRAKLQFEYLEDNPDVDILGGKALVVDIFGNEVFCEGIAGSGAVLTNKLFDNPPFKHPTFMIRTAAVARLGDYSELYPFAEDYEILWRYSRFGKIACLSDVVIKYVKDPMGISYRKRSCQLKSRLKIQRLYFSNFRFRSYFGVLRTVGTMLVPFEFWEKISRLYWRCKEVGRSQALLDDER
jgi:glycosyltransferase involved in cell wall biosynthesis